MQHLTQSSPISRPPTTGELVFDRTFRGMTFVFAWLTILVVVFIVFEIGSTARLAMQEYGTKFLTTEKWKPGPTMKDSEFGILPQIWGTLYSSILGVAIGSAFGWPWPSS